MTDGLLTVWVWRRVFWGDKCPFQRTWPILRADVLFLIFFDPADKNTPKTLLSGVFSVPFWSVGVGPSLPMTGGSLRPGRKAGQMGPPGGPATAPLKPRSEPPEMGQNNPLMAEVVLIIFFPFEL